MLQDRYQVVDVALDAPGAKKIVMTTLDKAIAALPGLLFDIDPARLAISSGFLGRDRKGARLGADGNGFSLPASSFLNNRRCLRMDGSVGFLIQLMRGLTSKSYTLIYIGTLAPAVRDTTTGTSRALFSVYDGTTPTVWARIAPTTGALSFSTTSTIGGATVAQANLPASNTGAIFTFARDDATDSHSININGTTVATSTADAGNPTISQDKRVGIGSVDALSSTRSFYGDGGRFIGVDSNVLADAPTLFNEFVAAAKPYFGIA
jgi:hypothetical protein